MGNRIRTRNSPDMLLGMILQFEFLSKKCVDEASECSYEFNTHLFQSIPCHRFLYSKVLSKGLEDKSAIPISDYNGYNAGKQINTLYRKSIRRIPDPRIRHIASSKNNCIIFLQKLNAEIKD
ncbi:hypothetical protein Tco_1035494 [Tanacetum coccineum]